MLLGLFDGKNESAPLFDVHLRFHAAAAPKLAKAIGVVLNKQLALRKAEGRKWLRELRREMSKPRGVLPKDLKRFLRQSKTAKQRKQALLGYAARRTFASLSDVYSFPAWRPHGATVVQINDVRALLDAFSMKFGDVSADFCTADRVHDFLFRPIIKAERGYFCPIPDLLLWGNPSTAGGTSQNGRCSLGQVSEATSPLFGGSGCCSVCENTATATVLTTLKYWSAQFSEDHTVQEYELDSAILFNGVVFLVECKSGTMPTKAQKRKEASDQRRS